jgi:8-oxo-dGTP pyrophosphatase MutT (NUDIX family)
MPHIHEKIDFTVEVFIVYKNKVLLRLHDKHKIWLSVGGHVELNEDPNQAALREVKEEVGLEIFLADNRPIQLIRMKEGEIIAPRFMKRHPVSPKHEHVVLTYFATTRSDKVKVEHESDKSDDWKWVTLSELSKMDLKPDIRFYAQQALEELI